MIKIDEQIKKMFDERFLLSLKPTLTCKDKERLKELSELLRNVQGTKTSTYRGWKVFEYIYSNQVIAIYDDSGSCLRANSYNEIAKLIDSQIEQKRNVTYEK